RLTRLRARCEEITSARQADQHAAAPLANTGAAPASTWSDDEPLAVLRAMIGLGGPAGPQASLTTHLLDDLRPGADPHLTAIALHVAAPVLRDVAEELESDSRLEPPPTVTVSLLGHRVKLLPEGPEEESLAAAEEAISAAALAPPRPPYEVGALALGGVVCLVLAFLTHLLVGVAGMALLGFAGWLLWQRHQRSLSDAAYVAAQVSELRELADGAVWALHAYAREAEGRAEQAAADGADIIRLIRRRPRAA